MNRLYHILYIISLFAIYPCISYGAPGKPLEGMYLSANVSYLNTKSNDVYTLGTGSYFNPSFLPNSRGIMNAMARASTTTQNIKLQGILPGIGAGYNYELYKKLFIGLDFDIDVSNISRTDNITNSSSSSIGSSVFDFTIQKKINSLTTLRAKIAYKIFTNFLLHATGGIGFTHASLATTIHSSYSSGSFTSTDEYQKKSKLLTSMVYGAGLEYSFVKTLSVKFEYLYVNAGSIIYDTSVLQRVVLNNEPYSGVGVTSSAKFNYNIYRISINYYI